jgi:hypothetical protein
MGSEAQAPSFVLRDASIPYESLAYIGVQDQRQRARRRSGRERIYRGYPDVARDMISSRTFDGCIQLPEYVPAILAGPPGTSTLSA